MTDSKTFFMAVSLNNLERVEKMIQDGFDVNIRNKDKNQDEETVLFSVRTPEMLKLLVLNGLDINVKSWVGFTFLMVLAAEYQSKQLMKECLRLGSDVNLQDNEGRTVIMHIITFRKGAELFPLFYSNPNLDYEIKDKYGRTAGDYAKDYDQHKEYLQLILSKSENTQLAI